MSQFASGQTSVWNNILLAFKWVILRLLIIAGGIGLGLMLLSPFAGMAVSVIGALVHLALVVINPVIGLLFWLVLYPFSERVINIDLGAGIPDLSPTRFVIMFITVVILAQVATRKRPWPRLTKVDWAVLAFMGAVIVSTLVTDNPVAGLQHVYDTYLTPLIIYFLVKNLVVNRQVLDWALKAVLIIAAYSAVYIIYEQLTNNVIQFGSPPDQIITFNQIYVGYTENLRLVQGLHKGTHVFGLIFTMSLPFAFYYMFRASSSAKKLLYLLLIALLFVGLFYTYKRAAYFSVPISFLVIQFFYPKFRHLFFVMLVVFGLLIAVTWNQVSESAVVTERIQGSQLETANGRTDRWAIATTFWKQRPIFGHGFRQFERITGYGAVENFYLMVLVASGLVGLIPYILMLVFVITDSIALYRKVDLSPYLFADRELLAVFWGSFVAYVLKSFSGNQSALVSNAIFMLIIGVVVGSQQAALALKGNNRYDVDKRPTRGTFSIARINKE